MTDDLELRLRTAFRDARLPATPEGLRDALLDVVGTPVAATGGRSGRLGAIRYLAVAAILVVGALATWSLTGGGRPEPAAIQSTRYTYAAAPVDGRRPDAVTIEATATVLRARLAAQQIEGSTVTTTEAGELVIEIPGEVTVDADLSRMIDQFVTAVGEVAFVPLGNVPVLGGETVDLDRFPPLFVSDGVAAATEAVDQNGIAVLDIRLTQGAAVEFGAWTEAHVGEYFAIVVDGVAVSVPMINEAIPGGEIQVSAGGSLGFAPGDLERLVVLLDDGPLPVPLEMVSSEGPGTSPAA